MVRFVFLILIFPASVLLLLPFRALAGFLLLQQMLQLCSKCSKFFPGHSHLFELFAFPYMLNGFQGKLLPYFFRIKGIHVSNSRDMKHVFLIFFLLILLFGAEAEQEKK